MMEFDHKANSIKALTFLSVPLLLLFVSIILFLFQTLITYWLGSLTLSLFFTQSFILLHECGHLNFFENKNTNKIVGNLFGLLSGIPFYTWLHMHNLHHKWTGWRDLDPTTEKTVKPSGSIIMKWIANISWFLFIPVFYLSYMLSNYWNLFKIRRFVSPPVFKKSVFSVIAYFLVYAIFFYFYSKFIILFILPAFLISLVWKELIIMTQHTHIEIPTSDGLSVKPIAYDEQIKYSRSFYITPLLSRYFLLNFNLHEAHHAYPGLPAYHLDKIKLDKPFTASYFDWFIKAKSLKGEDFVFKTSKQTGLKF